MNEANKGKLKPCPFCGSSNVALVQLPRRGFWTMTAAPESAKFYSVHCRGCGTFGSMYCSGIIADGTEITEKEALRHAVRKWNIRTAPANAAVNSCAGSGSPQQLPAASPIHAASDKPRSFLTAPSGSRAALAASGAIKPIKPAH